MDTKERSPRDRQAAFNPVTSWTRGELLEGVESAIAGGCIGSIIALLRNLHLPEPSSGSEQSTLSLYTLPVSKDGWQIRQLGIEERRRMWGSLGAALTVVAGTLRIDGQLIDMKIESEQIGQNLFRPVFSVQVEDKWVEGRPGYDGEELNDLYEMTRHGVHVGFFSISADGKNTINVRRTVSTSAVSSVGKEH